MNRVLVLVAVLLAVTFAVLWLAGGSINSVAAATSGEQAGLVQTVLVLALVLSSLVLGGRTDLSTGLRYGLMWALIFGAILIGYSYRQDMAQVWTRVTGEVNPARAVQRSATEIALRKASDGHFYADADVNGTEIRMLADTGASMVVLSEADAERAGIDPDQLDYTMVVMTANGQASAARVTLDEVRIGSIVRRDVPAAVSRGLSGSLLGMSFFNTLTRVEMNQDELVLAD